MTVSGFSFFSGCCRSRFAPALQGDRADRHFRHAARSGPRPDCSQRSRNPAETAGLGTVQRRLKGVGRPASGRSSRRDSVAFSFMVFGPRSVPSFPFNGCEGKLRGRFSKTQGRNTPMKKKTKRTRNAEPKAAPPVQEQAQLVGLHSATKPRPSATEPLAVPAFLFFVLAKGPRGSRRTPTNGEGSGTERKMAPASRVGTMARRFLKAAAKGGFKSWVSRANLRFQRSRWPKSAGRRTERTKRS